MKEWNIQAGDPCSLTLSCDARLEKTDYANDQTWELHLTGGEPAAISIETTFGLRARLMRILPRFIEGGIVRNDPLSFAQLPSVRRMAPNYLAVEYSPFTDIDVLAEYWVPRSQVLVGKISVANNSATARQVNLELIAQLNPLKEGHGMTAQQMQVTTILEGQTENLAPVLFLNGGPEPGFSSYPSLVLELNLAPGSQRHLTWALAALSDRNQSFDLARRSTARPWEAEMAHIRLQDYSAQIEIETGDTEWDLAFACSQKVAYSLLSGPEPALPHASFVLTRRPDQGYSLKGDGSDYPHLWNGQTALDAYLLSNLLLPGGAEWMRGILLNFLAAQSEDGMIDWKPGLAGQRSRLAAQPVLATLTWRIYQHDQDRAFLAQVFPHLLRFFQAWFSPRYDLDGDGFPEWDKPFQSGLDFPSTVESQQPWQSPVEEAAVEDPALGAFLRRECQSLIQIARQIKQLDAVPGLERRLSCLQEAVESCWDPERKTYRYRDRDSHVLSQTNDYAKENISQLLPLWAMIPSPDRARQIIEQTLLSSNRYAAPYGLRTEPASAQRSGEATDPPIYVSWNSLIGEGMLEYGYRAQVTGVVEKLMAGVIDNLRRVGSFNSAYAAEGGAIAGQPNHLHGLAPLRLYLETLGVRILSPWKVIITDYNPFPEPVTVQYRGLIIVREDRMTRVTFPDGQVASLTDPGAHLISTT